MASEVFSGPRAIFKLDGIPIGFAGGVRGEEEIGYDPIAVLGEIAVIEHVPVSYSASLSASIFRAILSSLKAYGSSKAELMSKEENILTSGALTATLEDRIEPGVNVAHFEGVRISNRTFTVSARSIVGENISCVAIRVRDEAEL